ncbi:MAG: hypothetical protein KIT81_17165, partial [Alphaproteobacteria bacterium]|nr:hypothetical protein [Alphaproteobacteria bacterium]
GGAHAPAELAASRAASWCNWPPIGLARAEARRDRALDPLKKEAPEAFRGEWGLKGLAPPCGGSFLLARLRDAGCDRHHNGSVRDPGLVGMMRAVTARTPDG